MKQELIDDLTHKGVISYGPDSYLKLFQSGEQTDMQT